MAHEWFFLDGEEVVGPLSPGEVRECVRSGAITRDTRVRRDDRADFIPAGQIRGLFPPLREDEDTSSWKAELGIPEGQGLFREEPPTAALRRAKGTAAFRKRMNRHRRGR